MEVWREKNSTLGTSAAQPHNCQHISIIRIWWQSLFAARNRNVWGGNEFNSHSAAFESRRKLRSAGILFAVSPVASNPSCRRPGEDRDPSGPSDADNGAAQFGVCARLSGLWEGYGCATPYRIWVRYLINSCPRHDARSRWISSAVKIINSFGERNRRNPCLKAQNSFIDIKFSQRGFNE